VRLFCSHISCISLHRLFDVTMLKKCELHIENRLIILVESADGKPGMTCLVLRLEHYCATGSDKAVEFSRLGLRHGRISAT